MKKFFEDFKAFINRGNVVDMAVGVVIATAFGNITCRSFRLPPANNRLQSCASC